MRVLATADLHYNHPKSRRLADEVIERINRAGGDVLLVIGDTAAADGQSLEQCLERFEFAGPKLFVAGNHELWTHGPDSYTLFQEELPRRVRAAGWHWLEGEPFLAGPNAIIGTIGWYDFSFVRPELGVPLRFYQHKIAPGSAAQHEEYAHLFGPDDLSPDARQVFARWNDGRFVKLHRGDEQFLGELLRRLERQLAALAGHERIVVGVHHLPFRELLPPPRSAMWDFARAFLGSERIGELLLRFPNVRHVLCGHSHLPQRLRVGHAEVINIGSGYRWKTYEVLDLPE